ncbi:IS630 family transposase [Brucella rhizosphaerae]|uniref:IS630 family transposase n=1 Tax=Brucella rhizosphaerae TaxID=571254 RepID=UPI0004B4BEF3|nr:IS630 family transposase [Brucella rhizosphaerae]
MYNDPVQWTRIRRRVAEGETIRGVSRTEKISRKTVRKMLQSDRPSQYLRPRRLTSVSNFERLIDAMLAEDEARPQCHRRSVADIFRSVRDHHGYGGSYGSIRRYCCSVQLHQINFVVRPLGDIGSINSLSIERESRTYRLDPSAMQGSIKIKLRLHRDRRSEQAAEVENWIDRLRADRVELPLRGNPNTNDRLLRSIHDPRNRQRNRAIVALAHEQGFPTRQISACLGVSRNTCRRYLRIYREGGVERLFAPMTRGPRKSENDDLKTAVFRTLHEPPKDHGMNRTSWIMRDLRAALISQGNPVCLQILRQIIHDAGWKWRKARIVLTSQDPDYREKLAAVQAILSNLASDEAFFSIDEFGPFAVKMKPGLMLDPPGPHRIVPQWQKSKGCMIMTAALELSGNQVTHFYSDKKNTAEIIRMMDVLLERYATRRTLYLSWDAASWHVSKKLNQRINEHNATASALGLPRVETAPLPSGAQFLNVIESVFSGMARAVIHNSNYLSVEDARTAIDRYFADRNQHFLDNPKRAGKRIWGDERVPSIFTDSNNCKDPCWR